MCHQMCSNITQWKRKQSLSKQMCLISIISFAVVIIFSDICLLVQFQNVREIERNFASGFYEENIYFSVAQIAKQTTKLMQVGMDFQTNYLIQIKGCIHTFQHSLISSSFAYIKPTQFFITKDYNQPAVYKSSVNDSIFKDQTHAAVNHLLRTIASPIITFRLKRINVWYQNTNNPHDYMVKTLPGDNDFLPAGAQDLLERMGSTNVDSLTVAGPYFDNCSASNTKTKLIALRTKLSFKQYEVLLQVQIFAYLTNKVLNRVKYSDQTNVIFLAVTGQNKFQVIGNTDQLDPNINYSSILTPGYHQTSLDSGQTLYSFTQPFPIEYQYGAINGITVSQAQQPLRIMITTTGVSQDMKQNIQSFIEGSFIEKVKFVIIFTCILSLMAYVLSSFMQKDISHSLEFITVSLSNFSKKPTKYLTRFQFTSGLMKSKWQNLKSLHKRLYPVIKEIQTKLRNNHKRVNQQHMQNIRQIYPQNLIFSKFVNKYGIEDIQKLNKMRILLKKKDRSQTSLEEVCQQDQQINIIDLI